MPYEYNIPTNLLMDLIDLIYTKDELKPQGIGEVLDERDSVDVFLFNAIHTRVNREEYNQEIKSNQMVGDEKYSRYNDYFSEIKKILDDGGFNYKVGDQYSFEKYRGVAKVLVYVNGDAFDFFKNKDNYGNEKIKKVIVAFSGSNRLEMFELDNEKYIGFNINKLQENSIKLINTISGLLE